MPTMRRAMYASILSAIPLLYEPMFLAEISVPRAKTGIIYTSVGQRRWNIIGQDDTNVHVITIKAIMPVVESFGFDEELKKSTSGDAFLTLCFDSYRQVPGDLYDEKPKNNIYAKKIRDKKVLKSSIPVYQEYLDKLWLTLVYKLIVAK